MLLQRDDVLDDAATQQPEIAGVRRDVDLADAPDYAVAERRDDPLGQRLPLPGPPLGVDDVVALLPARDELGDQLRGILQVAVDHDDGIAAGGLQAGERGHRLPKAPGEAQRLHAPIALAQVEDQLLGAVGAGIDAEDDLPAQPETVEHALSRRYIRSTLASSL